jgi:hypothetical protein
MQRKGIVLLITIALLAILTPLILISLGQIKSTTIHSQNNKIALSSSLFLENIINLLQQKAKLIQSNKDLDSFITSMNFYYSGTDIFFELKVLPVLDKININNLYFNQKKDPYISNFILNLTEKYKLNDGNYLLSLLLDTIDEDTDERATLSEIKLQKPQFRNGLIVNTMHLKKIMQAYYNQTLDPSIFNIPWEKYIYFGEKDTRNIIDCNIVSDETLELLGIQLTHNSRCKISKNSKNQAIATELKISPFSKNQAYLVDVQVKYVNDKTEEVYHFIYDVNKQHIEHLQRVWL